ncbi:hypothetical protein MHZ92_04115 [Sporosarcina sp. ACRSL]|uniref:hypothetical protein n=1 Tax=Sporosarcina sp. ACRSL TaxID=2918215 RepID=UPI001EF41A9C|nr:hypothetical protein [Sporosarcina sp. ACRSL]MCG7343302.1 hypothetical protein [Sporosarcina sp. ACRSL]
MVKGIWRDRIITEVDEWIEAAVYSIDTLKRTAGCASKASRRASKERCCASNVSRPAPKDSRIALKVSHSAPKDSRIALNVSHSTPKDNRFALKVSHIALKPIRPTLKTSDLIESSLLLFVFLNNKMNSPYCSIKNRKSSQKSYEFTIGYID